MTDLLARFHPDRRGLPRRRERGGGYRLAAPGIGAPPAEERPGWPEDPRTSLQRERAPSRTGGEYA
jgi:hypothetical protein